MTNAAAYRVWVGTISFVSMLHFVTSALLLRACSNISNRALLNKTEFGNAKRTCEGWAKLGEFSTKIEAGRNEPQRRIGTFLLAYCSMGC